ncbi:MAG: insulinase family protein [Phycisphaerales bacterium]|nr:insulinase family protein [Phycisphaerales bacterium]
MNQTRPQPARPLAALIGWAIAALIVLTAPVSLGNEPRSETLPNGLRIEMFPDRDEHNEDGSRGALQVWLQVHSGSIDERDDERGAAMVFKRAAMFGTATMDETQIHDLFSIAGADASIGNGAFAYFDQTTYMLAAPDDTALSRVLGFYADLLTEPRVDAPAFTRARDALLTLSARASENSMQQWMPEILSGVPIGDRMPLAGADALRGLTLDRVNSYAKRNYTPANATLVIVGPFDPEAVTNRIAGSLGGLESAPPPGVDHPSGTAASGRVSVVTNTQDRTDVALVWFEHNRFAEMDPASSTRKIVLEKVASELVRHRINAQIFRSLDGVVETDGSIVNLSSGIRAAQVVAAINTDAWENALDALLGELNRLRNDPIGEAEFGRARRVCLMLWQNDQDEWASLSTNERARSCNWIINAGLCFDPARWGDEASGVLATITNEEIHATLRRVFDPDRCNLIVLSSQDDVPSREAARTELDSRRNHRLPPLALDWVNTAAPPILTSIPVGGEIREITQHPGSGVWTARMDNGVVVHQRTMSDITNTSEIRVSLQRTIDDRTLEEAAISGWQSPSTTRLNSDEVRGILSEHGLTLDVHADTNSVQLSIRAPAGSIDRAIELAYVLLADAQVDDRAFGQWQHATDEALDESEWMLDAALDAVTAPEPCSARSTASVSHDEASRALRELARSAPIEIAIVGPEDTEHTLDAAETFLGALPARPLPGVRPLPVETGNAIEPECVLRVVDSEPAHHGAVVGLVAGEASDLPRLRALILTSMILNARLSDQVRAGELPGDTNAGVVFDDRFPGRALLLIGSRGPNPGEQGEALESALNELAQTAPTRAEIDAQTGFIRGVLDSRFESTRFWADRLADLEIQGYTPGDIWNIREAYLAMTPDSLHALFADSYAKARHLRVEFAPE